MRILEFLQSKHVPFTAHRHSSTPTAQEMAHAMHETGDHIAKTVVLKADGQFLIAVLQATHSIDLDKVRAVLGADAVSLATKQELGDLFPDCESGAVPPFGSKYGLRTLVDRPIIWESHVLFEGNAHDETIRMKYRDFDRLERPQIADFSSHV